jgi:hypothetical protein
MPAFNFKHRFARKVETGEKRHTVRAPRKDGQRPKPGTMFYGYEGMRTKKCRKLLASLIIAVQDIVIEENGRFLIGGRWLPVDDAHAFAVADGFTSATEMYEWFKAEHGLPFVGHLIHWEYPPHVLPNDIRLLEGK